jgi:hypothetical protein
MLASTEMYGHFHWDMLTEPAKHLYVFFCRVSKIRHINVETYRMLNRPCRIRICLWFCGRCVDKMACGYRWATRLHLSLSKLIPSGNQLHGLLENPSAIVCLFFFQPETYFRSRIFSHVTFDYQRVIKTQKVQLGWVFCSRFTVVFDIFLPKSPVSMGFPGESLCI